MMLTNSASLMLVIALASSRVSANTVFYRNAQCWGTDDPSEGRLNVLDTDKTEACCNTKQGQPDAARYERRKGDEHCAIYPDPLSSVPAQISQDAFVNCCGAARPDQDDEDKCCTDTGRRVPVVEGNAYFGDGDLSLHNHYVSTEPIAANNGKCPPKGDRNAKGPKIIYKVVPCAGRENLPLRGVWLYDDGYHVLRTNTPFGDEEEDWKTPSDFRIDGQ
ncbi:MAG: hypothetical protein M1837_003254 [Sclerophora amabilis]|nr:MAG: hypothetical protein M1837_003254 [Sclerophora amabilis]